jgi:acetyl-CoA carboxylase biotin carboxyl carrier protein
MAGSSSNQDIFDVRKIRRLVDLMNERDLNEIDLRQGDMRIRLRRVGGGAGGKVELLPAASAAASAPPNRPAEKPATATAEPGEDADRIVLIRSPMVGTFYAAPDPDSPPFVKAGDHVGPDTTVCIVEAMKVFNQIPAEVSGKIAIVLVENGEPVEFGQPMFKVDTRE